MGISEIKQSEVTVVSFPHVSGFKNVGTLHGKIFHCPLCHISYYLCYLLYCLEPVEDLSKKENNLKRVVIISINKDRQFAISSQNYLMWFIRKGRVKWQRKDGVWSRGDVDDSKVIVKERPGSASGERSSAINAPKMMIILRFLGFGFLTCEIRDLDWDLYVPIQF